MHDVSEESLTSEAHQSVKSPSALGEVEPLLPVRTRARARGALPIQVQDKAIRHAYHVHARARSWKQDIVTRRAHCQKTYVCVHLTNIACIRTRRRSNTLRMYPHVLAIRIHHSKVAAYWHSVRFTYAGSDCLLPEQGPPAVSDNLHLS